MTKRFINTTVLALFAVLLIAGCDNSFEPKAEYREALVVYAVFSASQEKQIVRLESTYDAEYTNPEAATNKRVITSADVYVHDGKKEYKFVQEPANEPNSPVPFLWTSTELVPVEGRTYTMRVVIGGATVATSSMQIPSRPFLQMEVGTGAGENAGGLRVGISAVSTVATPKGYYFRLYVLGISSEGKVVGEEIPYAFNPEAGTAGEYIFPSPGRETAVIFPTNYVKQWKEELVRTHLATDIMLMAVGSSMDTHFYNYYKVVRGFDDPVSVRQDNPNITNIQGGMGVFGGMTVDTLIRPYTGLVL